MAGRVAADGGRHQSVDGTVCQRSSLKTDPFCLHVSLGPTMQPGMTRGRLGGEGTGRMFCMSVDRRFLECPRNTTLYKYLSDITAGPWSRSRGSASGTMGPYPDQALIASSSVGSPGRPAVSGDQHRGLLQVGPPKKRHSPGTSLRRQMVWRSAPESRRRNKRGGGRDQRRDRQLVTERDQDFNLAFRDAAKKKKSYGSLGFTAAN
ncbi:hypothetical protein EYF80_043378 [Liparis tanakae]|uniref:Uncharacterized protein n=1 Tax=Liparis tanakae TaxID=230148 RepID=A0A4Z2G1L3_9TELE|nr:hypothetical protein EYF80_043378 [Liparis tanakae]